MFSLDSSLSTYHQLILIYNTMRVHVMKTSAKHAVAIKIASEWALNIVDPRRRTSLTVCKMLVLGSYNDTGSMSWHCFSTTGSYSWLFHQASGRHFRVQIYFRPH